MKTKFRFVPMKTSKYIGEFGSQRLVVPPNIPRSAWRDGEYYLRNGKGQSYCLICHKNQWFVNRNGYKNSAEYKDIAKYSAFYRSPLRSFTERESQAVECLLQCGVIKPDQAAARLYGTWKLFLDLRKTERSVRLSLLKFQKRGRRRRFP